MTLASDVERNLLDSWRIPNFAAGMLGENGRDATMLNWRIAGVVDDGVGSIRAVLNVPSGSTNQADVSLLARRIFTLSAVACPALMEVHVVTSDGELVGVMKRARRSSSRR